MTADLSQALRDCRARVEELHKDIARLKADNARLQADCCRRIPREHYAQMQAQIDELSHKCVRLSNERDLLRARLADSVPAEKVRALVEQWSDDVPELEVISGDAAGTLAECVNDLSALLERNAEVDRD